MKESEVKQTLEFLGINEQDIAEDAQLKSFLLKFLEVIGGHETRFSIEKLFGSEKQKKVAKFIMDQVILE